MRNSKHTKAFLFSKDTPNVRMTTQQVLRKRRRGVSQVTTAIVLMVLGIALAVLVYQVVLGATRGSYRKIEAGTPKSNIQIMAFDPGNATAGSYAKVYVKNLGPSDIEFSGPSEWQVFIDDEFKTISSLDPASGSLRVGESINITLSEAINANVSHTIKVFGPRATIAYAGWSPGGG